MWFALAFHDHHKATSNPFAQNLIQGPGNGEGGFAGANHVEMLDMMKIENVVLHSKESIAVVITNGFSGGLVWIYISEGGVDDIRCQSSSFDTSVG